jgi:hypothetical protein
VPVGNQYPEINSLHPVHQLQSVHQRRNAETFSIHRPTPKRIFFCYQKSKTIASSWSYLHPTLTGTGDYFFLETGWVLKVGYNKQMHCTDALPDFIIFSEQVIV